MSDIAFLLDGAFQEMTDFLTRAAAEGPPKSQAEIDNRNAEFIAIQKRCNDRAMQILTRLNSPIAKA